MSGLLYDANGLRDQSALTHAITNTLTDVALCICDCVDVFRPITAHACTLAYDIMHACVNWVGKGKRGLAFCSKKRARPPAVLHANRFGNYRPPSTYGKAPGGPGAAAKAPNRGENPNAPDRSHRRAPTVSLRQQPNLA
jgi:hypothetical protein